MEQQTAVEWLEAELKKIPFVKVDEVFKQAKAMEKEQIIKAAKVILFASTGQGDAAAEKYYNEKYNK